MNTNISNLKQSSAVTNTNNGNLSLSNPEPSSSLSMSGSAFSTVKDVVSTILSDNCLRDTRLFQDLMVLTTGLVSRLQGPPGRSPGPGPNITTKNQMNLAVKGIQMVDLRGGFNFLSNLQNGVEGPGLPELMLRANADGLSPHAYKRLERAVIDSKDSRLSSIDIETETDNLNQTISTHRLSNSNNNNLSHLSCVDSFTAFHTDRIQHNPVFIAGQSFSSATIQDSHKSSSTNSNKTKGPKGTVTKTSSKGNLSFESEALLSLTTVLVFFFFNGGESAKRSSSSSSSS